MVYSLLFFEGVAVGSYGRILHLVTLQFQVLIIAKYPFEPRHRLFGTSHVVVHDFLR